MTFLLLLYLNTFVNENKLPVRYGPAMERIDNGDFKLFK